MFVQHFRRGQRPLLAPGLDDGTAKWMVRSSFGSSGKAQQLVLAHAVKRDHGCQTGLAFRQRAGLVEGQRVDCSSTFQMLAALDQDAASSRPADAGDNRHRRRDHQRAGATNDQQGQCQPDVLGEGEGKNRKPDDRGCIPLRETLDHALAGRFFLLRFLDALDDARKRGVCADIGGANAQETIFGDGPGMDAAASRLFGWHWLAGDGGLGDGGGTLGHLTVDRDALASLGQHDLARLHFMGRYVDRLTIAQDGGGSRRGVQQFLQCAAGLTHGPHLEPCTEHEEEGDGGRFPDFANHQCAHSSNGDKELDAQMLDP